MTSADIYARIRNDAQFHELIARRQTLARVLSSIVLVCHFGFILIVGFAPDVLGMQLSDHNAITLGLPLGMGMVLFFWILTGIYVYFANRDFDALTAEIVKRATR